MRVVAIILVAFIVAALVTNWLRPLSLRLGLVDHPDDGRKRHRKATPLVGGIGILAGLMAGMLCAPSLGSVARHQFIALIVALLPVVAVGLWEDYAGASRRLRVFAHLVAALVLIGMGGVVIENVGDLLGWDRDIILDVWGVPFTVLCIVGFINAMNMLDGTDGLAGGTALVALSWYAIVGANEGAQFQSLLAFTAIGAVAGFLIFNARSRFRRRASVFLGDTGSTVLGILLVWLSITLSQRPGSTFPAAMSAWVLAVPLLDTIGVIVWRLSAGRSPFVPDLKHMHHRLLRSGYNERETVAILIFSAVAYGAIGVAAWQLKLPQHWLFAGAFILLAAYLFAIYKRDFVVGWIRRHPPAHREPPPKVIFVNKYFHPDISATSQMLSDLAFHLAARGYDVCVVASRQRYGSGATVLMPREDVRGVRVFRVWTSSFGRHTLLGRAVDYLSFYVFASLRVACLARAVDVVVVKTDPPLLSIPMAIVARLCGAQMVNWVQDVYPEIGERVGVLPSRGALFQALRRLRRTAMRRASVNVVLGERMYTEVSRIAGTASRVSIVPNWANGKLVQPLERSELKSQWGLQGKFVVGYSGNMGRVHDFETILQACKLLSETDPDIAFLFVGSGHRKRFTQDRAKELGLDTLVFKDYQPLERLSDSLAAADVHLANLPPELEGLIVPSKFYGIAAAGRPTVFVGDLDGEVPRLLARFEIGHTVPQGDACQLAAILRRLRDDGPGRIAMGQRARRAFEEHWDHPIAMREWEHVLEAVEIPAAASVQTPKDA